MKGGQCAQTDGCLHDGRQRGKIDAGQTHIFLAACCCRRCRACTFWRCLHCWLCPAPTGLLLGRRRRCPRSSRRRRSRRRRCRRTSPLAQLQKLVEQQGWQPLPQQLPLQQRQLQKLKVAARARWGQGPRGRVRQCLMSPGGSAVKISASKQGTHLKAHPQQGAGIPARQPQPKRRT